METMIKSKEFTHGVYEIGWRYHQDEFGVYWYNYSDVINVIELKWKVACKLYNEFLKDDEKFTFEDCNNEFHEFNLTNFISSDGFDRLLQHENERNNKIRKIKLEMDCKEYVDELKHEIDNLQRLVNEPIMDFNKIGDSVDRLWHMKSVQQGIGLDFEKEELLEDIRNEVYSLDYIDAVDVIFEMKKKPGTDDPEIRELLYQKHKGQESTCPSWLKEVIR